MEQKKRGLESEMSGLAKEGRTTSFIWKGYYFQQKEIAGFFSDYNPQKDSSHDFFFFTESSAPQNAPENFQGVPRM